MLKKSIFCIIFIVGLVEFSTAQNQQTPKLPLYITILVDAERAIHIGDKMIKFDEIQDAVKAIVYNQPASKYEGVVYKIYGDESLKLGYIMDVGIQLKEGFHPLKEERYLLNMTEYGIDGSNYIEKLEKLDLKAIED